VIATSGTYPCSFVTHIFHNGQPSQDVQLVLCYRLKIIIENIVLSTVVNVSHTCNIGFSFAENFRRRQY